MTNGFVGKAKSHYTDLPIGVLYIQGYNVKENSFDFHGIKYVTPAFHRSHQKSSLQFEDLLTVQTGEVGLTTIIPESLIGSNCHALIISRFDKRRTSPRYVSFYLNSNPGRSRLRLIETGTTMKHLNVGDMLEFVIPLPPTIDEQEAIAGALSDADAYIESLEKLIAKKRLIKQGAMQELLTGKRRLPGFQVNTGYKYSDAGMIPKDWKLIKLGSICGRITTGKLDANAMVANGQYRFYTCAKSFYQIDKYAFDAEALLVSGNGANVGYIHYYKGKFNAYQRTYVLLEFRESIRFVQNYLGQRLAERIRVEVNAGNTPYITMGTLTEMNIILPTSLKEQEAIAEILSDLDTELISIKAKLSKARQVKHGMMQELLTGRIRLV